LFVGFIVGLAAVICGLLEINLVEQALFNPYTSGSIMMVMVGLVLFGLAGSACDHLINSNFREPVVIVDELMNFAREHQGKDLPPDIARKEHISSVDQIGDVLDEPHRLTLIEFDQFLGQMEVLVHFDKVLVKCTVIYSQPTNCIPLPDDA